MRVYIYLRFAAVALASAVLADVAAATDPGLNEDACLKLRAEQTKFQQSNVAADMQRGPQWAKANLAADRLAQIEDFIALDEQIKFGCRDAKLPDSMIKPKEDAKAAAAPAGQAKPATAAKKNAAAPKPDGKTVQENKKKAPAAQKPASEKPVQQKKAQKTTKSTTIEADFPLPSIDF